MSTHHCHWPGCSRSVPPAKWGCYSHWMSLPQDLRARLWKVYVPGQEITKTPSREYLAVADEIQQWIKRNHRKAQPGEIFVFGGNTAGRHGMGAAKYAVEHHGAIYGRGEGLQGRSYAIPTKDAQLRTLPIDAIAGHVDTFLQFARTHADLTFRVTAIGCGLAGYQPADIAPLFASAPSNCVLPDEFLAVQAPARSSVPTPAPRRQASLF
jgi:hypothetical protein